MPKHIFISHISEEAEAAARLKHALERDFLGMLDVFVSSDTESIAAGEQWLSSIDAALREAAMLLILCSPESVTRPWINFEAGAAWMRQIPLVPVCHAGLVPHGLPMPLSLRQGVGISDPSGLQRLYGRVAEVLGCRPPERRFEELASELLGSPQPPTVAGQGANADDESLRARLLAALEHPSYKWRKLGKVAAAGAVSEEIAARILRATPAVRFSRNSDHEVIVGLVSRVGPG